MFFVLVLFSPKMNASVFILKGPRGHGSRLERDSRLFKEGLLSDWGAGTCVCRTETSPVHGH